MALISKILGLAIVAVATCLSSGCTYEYGMQVASSWTKRLEIGDQYSVYRQNSVVFPANIDLCVAVPASHSNRPQNNYLSSQVNSAVASRVTKVTKMDVPMATDMALREAYENHCDFMLYPQVVYRQDNISSVAEMDAGDSEESEMGFDRQWLQLAMYDVNSATLADVTLIKGRSSFFTFSAHTPDDLIQSTLTAYVDSVFAFNSLKTSTQQF